MARGGYDLRVTSGLHADRRARGWPIALGVTLAAVGAAAVPMLPAGPDVYVHLLWTQQVMRCFSDGALPVWLPDLNAGFGSPGLRLYSPLGPVLAGALGLLLGGAGQGMRALAVLVAGMPLAALWRRRRWGGVAEWALVVASPMAIYSLFWRSAWSEFYALPLMWWLIDRCVAGEIRATKDGVALALLWLLHAPTAMMTVLVASFALAARREGRVAGPAALAGVLAAGLTAWHWLPLYSEMRLVGNREALVGGIYEASRNVLAAPAPADADANSWLAWCGVSLLGAALAGAWWRNQAPRLAIVSLCVVLASPLAASLWRMTTPLAYLQFPWRLLLPAAVAAAGAAATSHGGRAALSGALLLVPLALFQPQPVAPDPDIHRHASWVELGRSVQGAFEGSPWVVDAAQNRPASFAHLADNLGRFGYREVVLSGSGSVRVERWRVLDRELALDLPAATRVDLRLLDYPFWEVTLDGAKVANPSHGGVIGADVPAGTHALRARWAGNPASRVGWVVGALAVAVLAVVTRRRRRGR